MSEKILFENMYRLTKQLKGAPLKDFEKKVFYDVCKKFYYDKTLSRLDKFYKKTKIKDKEILINNQLVPPLSKIFQKINWDFLSQGIAARYH